MASGKKLTQRLEVLKYLKTHKGLTSIVAFEKFGITRLSAVIFDLRKIGLNIISVWRTGTNRYGQTVRYVEYRLIKDDVRVIT